MVVIEIDFCPAFQQSRRPPECENKCAANPDKFIVGLAWREGRILNSLKLIRNVFDVFG